MNETWPLVSLADLVTLQRRPVEVREDCEYQEIGVYCFGKGVFHKQPRSGLEVGDKKLFLVKEGDLILQITFAWEGAISLCSRGDEGLFGSTRYPTFRIDERRCHPPFLAKYLVTKDGLRQINSICPGSAGRNRVLSLKRLKEVMIPLPPLEEQRRIMARLDKVNSKIRDAYKLRGTSDNELQQFINIRLRDIFNNVSESVNYKIEQIGEVRSGIQKTPNRIPGANPVRYLTVAHVQRNKLIIDDPRYFEVNAEELERWRLLSGDVLIIEGNGSAEQIGRTALFRGEIIDCVHQNHVIRIRPYADLILPEYLNAYLNSPMGQNEVQAQSRTTSGLRTLSAGRIKDLSVPVPSLFDQRRILVDINNLESQISKIRGFQQVISKTLDELMPSILDKAFKGEL